MKRISYIFGYLSLAAALTLGSCQETLQLEEADSGHIDSVEGITVDLRNDVTSRIMQNVELYGNEDIDLSMSVSVSKSARDVLNFQLEVDVQAIQDYNEKNGTNFKIYPIDYIVFPNKGELALAPGEVRTQSLKIKLKHLPESEIGSSKGESFLLPIVVKSKSTGLKEGKLRYTYVVKVFKDRVSATKPSGFVTSMFFEVNDTNPLNALEWTLKSTGKPFADIVCLFAANINISEETGRVFVHFNDNVRALLANRERYIKPLQDKGIKVTLGIVGNHDEAGLADLGPTTARAFAKELKTILDAYELDGVEFDDEYTEYTHWSKYPGLVAPSDTTYTRLCYETKRLMPDKICGMYHIGFVLNGFHKAVDNVYPADFIDYMYEAFYVNRIDLTPFYLGASNKQVSPYSRKLSNGRPVGTYEEFRDIREDGFGVQMLYDYKIKHAQEYFQMFNDMARAYYNDEIVFSGVTHSKTY